MLLDMLKTDKQFQDLPLPEQDLIARLASAFIEDQSNIFKSADELAESASIGNIAHWQRFLTLAPVIMYIKGQMAQIAQVASRKGFLSLQKEANAGNVQAIKQINELAGILNKADDNKVIVLSYIPRPKIEEEVNDGK
jgi:hypothetical protein